MDRPKQTASELARESKSLALALKERVKTNKTLDKEAESLRKNLRIFQLKLLLLHPNAREAKDAETHLWMQTSYQFISIYKQRIAILDRKLYSPAALQRQAAKNGCANANAAKPDAQGPPSTNTNTSGHVEYRRLLGRFRQFLAEEYKFYVRLLLRFRSQFGLVEVNSHLVKAEIITAETDEGSDDADLDTFRFLEQNEPFDLAGGERELRMATFAKLLVCLGDLARYREQYNDGGGRPRAAQEEGPPSKRQAGKNSKKEKNTNSEPPVAIARARNYMRAQVIYEQARLLSPNDGNASHQLAILCTYQKDVFGSLLNYYRALCVRHPYDTASENLNTVMRKALDNYKSTKDKTNGNGNDDSGMVVKLRAERFKEWIVVLHGIWYLDQDEHASRAARRSRQILTELKYMVTNRILPSPIISEVLILAFSALWKIRMVRDAAVKANKEIVEPIITAHILDCSRVLLDVGQKELSSLTTAKSEGSTSRDDLAQYITAPLRRMLPSLRILSKWLRTNLNYISSLTSLPTTPTYFRSAVRNFWRAYAGFVSALNQTFPGERLPVLRGVLEEDVELVGFSPIRRGFFGGGGKVEGTEGAGEGREDGVVEVHPNEEYLMRISDLLKDAGMVASLDKTPIVMKDGAYISTLTFTAPETEAENAEPITSPDPNPQVLVEEDEAVASGSDDSDDGRTEQTSKTDDDVVREAFDEALRDGQRDAFEEEEEEEQIVWNPSPYQHPQRDLHPHPLPLSALNSPQPPHRQIGTPKQLSMLTTPPAHLTSLSLSPGPPRTTAQDLLNNVLGGGLGMGGSRVRRDSAPPRPIHYATSPNHIPHAIPNSNLNTNPQSSLLFGPGPFNNGNVNGNSINNPAKSIWGNNELSAAQPRAPSHLPSHLGHLTPGHERARSVSLTQAHHQTQAQGSAQSQLFPHAQDSMLGHGQGSLGLSSASTLPTPTANAFGGYQTGLNNQLYNSNDNNYNLNFQQQQMKRGYQYPPGVAHVSYNGGNAGMQGQGHIHGIGSPLASSNSNLAAYTGLGGGVNFPYTGVAGARNGNGAGAMAGNGYPSPATMGQRSIWNSG